MKNIKLWFKRKFGVFTYKDIKQLNLTFVCNIYGDYINIINCRSIWEDKKGRKYRCHSLYIPKNLQEQL